MKQQFFLAPGQFFRVWVVCFFSRNGRYYRNRSAGSARLGCPAFSVALSRFTSDPSGFQVSPSLEIRRGDVPPSRALGNGARNPSSVAARSSHSLRNPGRPEERPVSGGGERVKKITRARHSDEPLSRLCRRWRAKIGALFLTVRPGLSCGRHANARQKSFPGPLYCSSDRMPFHDLGARGALTSNGRLNC